MAPRPLGQPPTRGIDCAVVTAVGDRLGTAWRVAPSASTAVESQLAAAAREAAPARSGRTRLLLGVEGADFVGHDPSRIKRLRRHGVRVLGLMHHADNRIGQVATTLTGRRTRDSSGLTAFGRELVADLNRRDIVIDLAHADAATTLTACSTSTRPVMASHTASASVHDFARYISDEEIAAIADTGGVIGLWQARLRGRAMNDLTDFARHAGHVAELVGVEHLSLGTDKNGVPDYLAGYRDSRDIINLVAVLSRHGFSDHDVEAILGRNARRVLGLDRNLDPDPRRR